MSQEGLDKGMITMRELAAAPATVVAGQGAVFVKNTSPSTLAFVGDDNAEHTCLTSGSYVVMSGMATMSGMANLSGSYIGQYQASGDYITSGQVLLSGEAGVSGAYVGLYVVSGWAQQSGAQCLVSGDLQGAISGMALRDGLQASGVYMTSWSTVGVVSGMGLGGGLGDLASGSIINGGMSGDTVFQVSGSYLPSEAAYGELYAANLGDGLVYNYLSGRCVNVELDVTSGRITLLKEGDYFVGFEAQMTATSGGSVAALNLRQNNTKISGSTQNVVSPGMVSNYSYCEGTTQACLIHGVSGDYFTAWQEESTGDWTMTAGKLYLFKR
jgi:hypothetical protein